ncbi:HesB/IscA family protein [Candidatus Cyrtobacter comes]|nr:iron-sulfur cluster assembly accessory protein [Candidatus Cyrtobacter comes]
MNSFNITDGASLKLLELLKSESEGARFRISIMGGGCSGFSYSFSFDKSVNVNDQIFSNNGVEVIIDEISMKFLQGSTLLYKSTLGSEAFEVSNPNTTAKCGCGNSFAV